MRLFKLCNCVIVIDKVGRGMCVVVQWFAAGVAFRICCIASWVCEVRASSTIMVGCVRAVVVVGGTAEMLASPLSGGGAVCLGGGVLREACICWGRVVVSMCCISSHRCAKVFW